MIFRRLLVIILCAATLFAFFTGCGNSEDSDAEPSPGDVAQEDADPAQDPHIHASGIDFDAAYAFFAPDTVMINAGGISMTWAELFIFLFRTVASLDQLFESGTGWSDILADNKTLAEITLEHSTEEALSFITFEYGAKVSGVTLSADDIEILANDVESFIDMFDSRDEFAASLRENGGFYDIETFENLLRVEYLVSLVLENLYGDDGASFPDEDVARFAEREEFLMAKHILRTKTEDGDDTPLKEIEDIMKQLNDHTGDDFEALFDALMHEHSEDTGGLMSFPQGYLFQHGNMVESFSDACVALDIDQCSDIVESEYGYHILLRLPVDYDAVPFAIANTGQYRTLRQLAAVEDFDKVLKMWRDGMTIEYTPEYNSIDLATIFARKD